MSNIGLVKFIDKFLTIKTRQALLFVQVFHRLKDKHCRLSNFVLETQHDETTLHSGISINPLSKVINFESSDIFYYEYQTFDLFGVIKKTPTCLRTKNLGII